MLQKPHPISKIVAGFFVRICSGTIAISPRPKELAQSIAEAKDLASKIRDKGNRDFHPVPA